MATLTGVKAAATAPVPGKTVPAGVLGVAWGYYALTANPTINDVINVCKLPAGATVIGGFVQAADLDTGIETLDIDVGWLGNGTDTADPDGFGNFGVQDGDVVAGFRPVAGIYLPFVNIIQDSGFKTFAAETTIAITITAVAATFAAGTIKVVCWYV